MNRHRAPTDHNCVLQFRHLAHPVHVAASIGVARLARPLMWAWSSPAELIFFNAAPLLFVGIDITFIYPTTTAEIACDWMSAGVYLAAGFFAWKRGRDGFEESHPH